MNKKNRNYWITEKEGYAFAGWEIILPYPDNRQRMYELLEMYKEISKYGDEIGAYKVTSKSDDFIKSSDCSYAKHIENVFFEAGELLSFGIGNVLYDSIKSINKFQCCSNIQYYDLDNKLQRSCIKDMCSLMIETRDIDVENTAYRFMTKTPPIDISQYYGSVDNINSYNVADTIDIYINLYTDIWFPWLRGTLENDNYNDSWSSHPVLGRAYDNRELAYYHTPLLNKFLSKISELVLDYGGKLEKGEEFTIYQTMFTENGIIID